MSRRPSASSIHLLGSPELNRQNGLPASVSSERNVSHTGEASQVRKPATRTASSSQKLNVPVDLNNMDPDELFTKHTVSEIKLVQSRLRAEADAKQEELRLMVGERYRDLLEASTSILNLAKSSKHVLEALEEMRDTVNSITPSRAPRRAATGEGDYYARASTPEAYWSVTDKHLQALQSLSAHVKLLLDAPEHLWRLMERKAYLNAAWLFLLARVVHRALSQDDEEQLWHTYGIDVTEQLPLVQRQWDTITPFRSQISHKATLYLREIGTTPGEVCATLLTLHLLESRPLPETLSIYLAQRTKTLSALLTRTASTSANGSAGDTKPNGRVSSRPRKTVVKETKQRAETVLDLVSRTVGTARLIFTNTSNDSAPILKRALAFFQAPTDTPGNLPPELQLSTLILLSSLPSASQLLLLPPSIRAYKPYVDGAPLATPELHTQVREKLQGWLKRAVQELREALTDWFAPLESVRDVWDVHSALLRWLEQAEGLESPERGELESIIDGVALQQAAAVWKTALNRLELSFRDSIVAAATALAEDAGAHTLDTRPVEHLFQAPPIPSGLQTGIHTATAAAAQFSKYRSALQHQLSGRTPLVDSALNVLESGALQLRDDLSAMEKSLESKSNLSKQLSDAYRSDAESVCHRICEVLESIAIQNGGGQTLRVSTSIGRIAQELAKSPSLFVHVGCGEAAAQSYRERLGALVATVIRQWQEQTISQIIRRHLDEGSPVGVDITVPVRPSPGMTEALLSLSSEIQHLGVSLDQDYRQQQIGSTLQRFVLAVCDRLQNDTAAVGPQVLWDLSFLRQLVSAWGSSCQDASERIDNTAIALQERVDGQGKTQTDVEASAQEYLAKTQILFATLLPSRPLTEVASTRKSEKPSSLLLFGTPPAEHGFESALQLIKPPPRFGLLLAGGAALR